MLLRPAGRGGCCPERSALVSSLPAVSPPTGLGIGTDVSTCSSGKGKIFPFVLTSRKRAGTPTCVPSAPAHAPGCGERDGTLLLPQRSIVYETQTVRCKSSETLCLPVKAVNSAMRLSVPCNQREMAVAEREPSASVSGVNPARDCRGRQCPSPLFLPPKIPQYVTAYYEYHVDSYPAPRIHDSYMPFISTQFQVLLVILKRHYFSPSPL